MKKSLLLIFGIIALALLSYAFTTNPDEPKYKNLKILPKNINEKQMDSVMHHFTGSLNVKCNFCHVRNEEKKEMDWASDGNKHKLVARQMMTMTNELNKKYFSHTGSPITLTSSLAVSCFTCHNGKTDPANKVPKAENAR